MSEVSRIFVIEGEEALNRSLVNSLRKEGYMVQGVVSGTDAVRALWSEEYDVVICDLKTPGADGFELLQWLRAYRPNTLMIMVGSPGSEAMRSQALENGATAYLEKPLDFRIVKEELRRHLQQTGFSADLDSFDLLDVIQIVNMSRKNIALLVNTGLEERGILRFQNGELVWAEYGVLRGEEAFFALAAHKNGTVIHQPWSGQVISNVTQPLSRLIFQALQYRTKYANVGSESEKHEAVTPAPVSLDEVDDTPFVFSGDATNMIAAPQASQNQIANLSTSPGWVNAPAPKEREKEWWELTGGVPRLDKETSSVFPLNVEAGPTVADKNVLFATGMQQNGTGANGYGMNGGMGGTGVTPVPMDKNGFAQDVGQNSAITPSIVHKTPASQRSDLPSWLTDQPTTSMPMVRPSSLSDSMRMPAATPRPPSSPDWQPPSVLNVPEQLSPKPLAGPQDTISIDSGLYRSIVREMSPAERRDGKSGGLEAKNAPVITGENGTQNLPPVAYPAEVKNTQPSIVNREYAPSVGEMYESNPQLVSSPMSAVGGKSQPRPTKRNYNYTALVSALQTLGYSVSGFIAAAVVSMDGQPIAQVAVDDLDIVKICKPFSTILRATQQLLNQSSWGDYEDMVIGSTERYVLLRVVGGERNSFIVLITTREADPAVCQDVLIDVEGAIAAALG
jgi:DNA-binding response OmpR family regulator/predicted regulator of Ras-like GTPase activity (Roadblock/LC7/MglB family)